MGHWLGMGFTPIALTFPSPFRPFSSLSQELHPLTLIARHFWIGQPSTATCEKEEEPGGEIWHSALESLGEELVSERSTIPACRRAYR
jgi:hypothetical protein